MCSCSESLDGYSSSEADKRTKSFISNEESVDNTHSRWRKNIISLFLVLLVCVMNGSVMFLLYQMMSQEFTLIDEGKLEPSLRVVNDKVVLALIGGTVAQVSALLVIAVKSIFQNK